MTRRGSNSLISIGGNSRGRGRRHASGKDLISDGMKYGAAFGIAHEGFKAWSSHSNNQQSQQQVQMVPQYGQQPFTIPQQRQPSLSPPPYSDQPVQRMTHLGHQSFCNGQCCCRCMAMTTGASATYYNSSNV